MALTYEESAALMNDPTFRGRVKVACMKFADFILIEPSSEPAHNARVRWAQMTISNPEGVAAQVQPPTVMDAAVQQDGNAITDAALQGAVENTVNKML